MHEVHRLWVEHIMNTSMQNLKPCPFCGHVGVNVHEGSTFRWVLAECDNCGAQSPEARRDTTKAWPNEAEDTPKAIAEWNTRTAIEVATLAAAPQWLPIADGLPKPMVDVLCLAKQINTGKFKIKQSCANPVGESFYVEYDEDGIAPIEEVTHWMPLPPTPPQGNP